MTSFATTSRPVAASEASCSTSTGPLSSSAPTTAASVSSRCRRKTVSFSPVRPSPEGHDADSLLMTEATKPVRRVSVSLKQLLALLISGLRRVVGGLFQLLARDQLSDLSRQAQRLGSAS